MCEAKPDEDLKVVRQRADLRIPALGSGSDYTVFLDHLGIASANLGYGGEDKGGIYHSIYDDFYWYTHFSDTDFSYGRALSQTDRKSTRLNSSHRCISYAVFCLKKKK